MSLLYLLNDLQSLWTTAFQSAPPTHSVFPCLTETAEGQKHAQYMMVQITTHTHSLTHTWHMAVVLWFVQNHYHATSRMQWSGTCLWQQLTFVKVFFVVVFCYQGLEWFTGMKTEIFPDFLLTTWFLNMMHWSGGLCSERGAGILIGVLLTLIYCVSVCLLNPLQKKSFAPHLSLGLSVRQSQLCVSVFLWDFSYLNNERVKCIRS